jgi:hypothetical protein
MGGIQPLVMPRSQVIMEMVIAVEDRKSESHSNEKVTESALRDFFTALLLVRGTRKTTILVIQHTIVF